MSTKSSALVVIDLQNWIVEMPWAPCSGTDVVDACVRLQEKFAEHDSNVVIVRYLRADGQDGGTANIANALVPQLRQRASEHVVTKNGLDAFENTDLDTHLRSLDVTTLVIAGLSTAHGVAATATTALNSGYHVVIASDATASVTAAEHKRALDQLAALGAQISTVEQILA